MTPTWTPPWWGWDMTERVEIDVECPGLRYPYSGNSEAAAWRQYGELRAQGANATIRRRRVVEHTEPWQDMTQPSAEETP